MRIRARAAVVLLAASVVACGERNVGVGATAERSTSNSESISVKSSKSATVAEDKTATVTLPLAALILNTLQTPRKGYARGSLSKLEQTLLSTLADGPGRPPLTAEERELLRMVRGARGAMIRELITDAVAPTTMWPVQPFDTHTGSATAEGRRWAVERYASLELANAVVQQIAETIATQPVYGQEDAREKALAAFAVLDHEALLRDYETWRSAARVAMMDGNKVAFTLTNGAGVEIGPAGPTLSHAGRPWFAADTVSGKTYQIALAKSENLSIAKSRDVAKDASVGASSKVDASATVK